MAGEKLKADNGYPTAVRSRVGLGGGSVDTNRVSIYTIGSLVTVNKYGS